MPYRCLIGAGSLGVMCDVSVPYTIALGSGNGAYASRRMVSGGNFLAYNLYTDVARTMIWGAGPQGQGLLVA